MLTVLVVDDDDRSRYYQEALLKAHGHTVVSARNGEEAMTYASSAPPDALLTDILMPKMDGFELCRRWAQHPRLSRRPVIFYTATYTEADDEAFALQLGAFAFLRKPSPPQEVLATLQAAVDEFQPRRSAAPDVGSPDDGLSREVFLETYNAVLVRKLEDKLQQLEQKNTELADSFERLERSERERRALAEQLHQAQKLEALGHMAANVAHDFRNLLTVIGSSLDLVARQTPEDSPMAQHLAIANETAERATRFTGQLLALGREQPHEPREISIADALAQLSPLVRSAAGRNVNVDMQPPPSDLRVHIDVDQLSQVLVNLALNARDAMPDGGQLVFGAAARSVPNLGGTHPHPLPPGAYVVLEVTDTGSGMAAEVAARIFEPYFTTKARGKGSGLGLATSYGIVRQNGGDLRVSSELDRGTRFEIWLPRVA